MKKLLLLLAINLLVLTTVANAKTYLPKNLTDSTCPEASFTFASHQGNGQSNSYVFVSTSFVYYGDMTYSWDFDDPGSGADNTSTLINPLHVFTTGGSKAVRLTVTNTATGCSVSSTQTINVALPASTPTPTAFSPSFTYSSTSACSVGGEIFSFSSAISAPAGSNYVWNFGDGSTATGDNPTHAYQYAGSYTVSLKALSVDNQLLGQFSAVVSAVGNNAKPIAGFSYLINTQNGNAVTFQSHSTIPSGSMTYFWDFGDGNTATTSNPTHVYTPGTSSYNVTLTVTGNPGGCSTTITQTISLVEPLLFVPNAASFTVTTPVSQCFTGHGYVFENNSLTGAGVSYIWDFGDGTTSTLHTPFTTLAPKVYSAYGDYIVKLTVIRNNDTIFTTRTVSVEPMPFADFELYVDRFANDGGPFLQVAPVPFPSPLPKTEIEQCFKYPIDFSYHSKSKIARGQMFYSWDFKTNAISYREGNSTFINPRIIFDTAGKYDVTLTVISDKGCKDSIRQTVRLSQPKGSFTVSYPQPDIRVNPLVTISLGTVRDPGYPENLPGQLTGVWTNTNGNTTPPTPVTAPAPFRYPRGGSYNPTLVVTSKIGCTNTFTQNVTFRVKPTKPVITSAVVTYNSLGQPVVALAGTGSVDETPQNLRYTWSYGVPGIGNWVHNTTTGNPTSHNKTYTIGAATASSNINLFVHNNNFNNGTLRDTALPVAVDVRIKPVLNAGVNISQSGPSASLPSASFGVGVELHDGAAAAALTYLWELYDGATASGSAIQTSTSATPTFSSLLGNHQYTVKVTITNANGGLQPDANVSFPTELTFTSTSIKPALTAAASFVNAAATTNAPSTTVAVGSSLADVNGNLTYAWSLYEGASAAGTVVQSSTDASPNFTGLKGNTTYTASVIVTNSNGGLQADANILYPTTVTFTTSSIKPLLTAALTGTNSAPTASAPSVDLSVGASLSDANGGLVYAWSLYEGGTASGTAVQTSSVATPTFSGLKGNTTYTASVIVTNSNGGLQADANVLYSTTYTFVSAAIKPEYVSAVISANALPSINAPRTWVSVSASLNDALGSLSYNWSLYEGPTASGAVVRTSTDPNPQFTNLKGNTQYTVVATVSNTNGGLAADINPLISNQLTFTTAAIIPNPIFPSVYIHDINVYANPMVTPITLPNYSNDNAGGTFSFVWDFGDGYTTTDVNPTHFYATGGPKTITLTATNSNGGLSASVSRNINIVITPKAKISVSVNTTDPLHNTVSFFADNTLNPSLNSSIVSGSITAYNWQIQMTQISTGITTSMTVSNNPIVVLDLGADLNDYTITAEVTAVSDLGVTDAATATWSNSGVNSGYTPFGGIRVGGGAAFIRVNRVIDEAMQIGVFPNPTVSTIQLGYPVIKGEFVNIIIVDPMGRVVRSERRGATVGVRNNAQLNVQNLAKGTYHVIIVSAEGKRIGATKFIKAK